MREKRSAPGVVERREPVPELVVVLWQLGLPGFVPLGDRLGRGTVLQIRRLDGEEYMPHRGLQASAWRGVLEGVEAELVQQRRQGDLRIVGDGISQCQGTVSGELADQPFRQRSRPNHPPPPPRLRPRRQ